MCPKNPLNKILNKKYLRGGVSSSRVIYKEVFGLDILHFFKVLSLSAINPSVIKDERKAILISNNNSIN